AEEWSGRVMAFCRRLDLGRPFARCRTHYGTALLWRGRWAEAEAELTGAARALSGLRPQYAAEAVAQLGELRRRQGRREEAAELFGRADATPDGRLGLAELRLDEGDPAGALDLAGPLLGALPPGASLERCRALELLVRAATALGPAAGASRVREAARELSRLAGTVGTDAVRASAAWAAALTTLHTSPDGRTDDGTALRASPDGGAGEDPDCGLRRAAALFERAGDAYNAARARLDLAAALLARDRPQAAAGEAATARETFVRLGAPAEARRAARLLARAHRRPEPGLTTRQREILGLVALGLTNRDIAGRLTLSEHTVKRHLANILSRLGEPTRKAAVAHASRAGLL
ncbi:hypothetical protein C1I98_25525, partial [Spongiactinospora gelatinilytica]